MTGATARVSYYADKIASLRSLFGDEHIELTETSLIVGEHAYPIIDDVIVLLDPAQYPPSVAERLSTRAAPQGVQDFAEDIQFSFGAEWQEFSEILPEHQREFSEYFDLVDIAALRDARVMDVGCGMGRWSYFLRKRCRELVLVDFSEAIFVARRNLSDAPGALFFMGDLMRLPFAHRSVDFLFCLGVLHHLPAPALDQVRRLKRFAPRLLIYLYYALDNRPVHYRALLRGVGAVRQAVAGVRSPSFRAAFTTAVTFAVYVPLVGLGKLLKPAGLASAVPLYDGYAGKGIRRIRQDVYDRFFTGIEQRYSRREIMQLTDTFERVRISDGLPYWHFVCED